MPETAAPTSSSIHPDPFVSGWRLLQSTRARHQSALLMFIGVLLFPIADRHDTVIAYLLMTFVVAAPLLLGVFIGLVSSASGGADLVMPRTASTAIWTLFVGGVMSGTYANDSTFALGLFLCAVSTAVLTGLLVVTAVDRSGGKFDGNFVFPAAIVSGSFAFFSSCASAAGFLLYYLDVHYAAHAGTFITRVIGRPEVFVLALPALALATVVIAKSARHHVPNALLLLPLVLFGIAGFTGFITKSVVVGGATGLRESRYVGTPYVFPVLLLILMWALSLVRGIVREHIQGAIAALLGALTIAIALLNKGQGNSTWTVGRIDASIIGCLLLVAFGGAILWLREEFKVTISPIVFGIISLVVFAGGLLTISYFGIGSQLFGDYPLVIQISVGKVGQGILGAGIGLAAIALLWATHVKQEVQS